MMTTHRVAALMLLLTLTVCHKSAAFEAHVLDNGLEVFIEENSVVPLVTIRITFKAGAIVETPAINGLCHLYEHMLFKGNELYRTQAEFMAALKRMGAGNWNGGTSTEYVTYYITIPSDQLEPGLQFWAQAVTSPLLLKEELVAEREVVYSEIAGAQSRPGHALRMAMIKTLYPDHWYRLDVGGDLAIIRAATVEQLLSIKNAYYVPNNAALFVAGDVRARDVLAAARRHFGDWQPGPGFPELQPHAPLARSPWVVVSNSPTPGIAHVSFMFRGPDTGIDTESTYAADVWGQMVDDPRGRFKNSIFETVPELHGGTRYIRSGYFTQRDAGTTSFSFQLQVPDEHHLWDVIVRLRNAVTEEVFRMMHEDYFTGEHLASAKQELHNNDILSRETPAGYHSNLSFWWASTSTDYYRSYPERIRAVTLEDIQAYLRRYVFGRHFLTSLWIHSEDDRRHSISALAERENR